jgi:hypothetical protein
MPVGRPPNPPLQEKHLACTSLIRQLLPFRDRLIIPQRREHGNTELHLDDVLMVLLAAFFNPTVRSQRLIEQFSQLSWAKEHLNVPVRRSTLSDALQRFEPDALHPLIQGLMQQIPHLRQLRDGKDLEQVCQQILAADGSYWTVPADVVWALHHRKRSGNPQGQVRLNLQLDVRTWTPAAMSVSGKAQGCEAAAFMADLRADVIYLVDRGFVHFGFINAVLEKGSDLVLRLRKSDKFDVHQERPLTAEDVAAGVLSDRVGVLPGNKQKRNTTAPPPGRPLREVVVRGTGREAGKTVRILTSLLELPAALIAQLFAHRWQIELFLRWLKVWANYDHLLSHSPGGITLQFYAAVVACLLMYVATGRKANRYALFLLGEVAWGRATLQEVLPMLEKIEREKRLERERLARRKAQKALSKEMASLPA